MNIWPFPTEDNPLTPVKEQKPQPVYPGDMEEAPWIK